MTDKHDDLFHTRRGVAVLIASLVQTLGESAPTFQDRYLKKLEKWYHDFRDGPAESIPEMELLSWTQEIVKGEWSGDKLAD
jgi:hypothetical protein